MTRVAREREVSAEGEQAAAFRLESDEMQEGAFMDGEQVYDAKGCRGGNISPSLTWYNPPEDTKSFAVTLHDPDAPMEGGFWHWVAFNIPAGTQHVPKGGIPEQAMEIKNGYGSRGYGGPCPPRGDDPHRYIMTVYALDVERIALDSDAMPEQVLPQLERHMLAKGGITALYGQG